MRDTATPRNEMIEHFEKALELSERASLPMVGYLIERALDVLRALGWREELDAPLNFPSIRSRVRNC